MPSKVAIIAALPREIAGLVRGTSLDASLLKRGIHLYRLQNAVVVAAGMGPERAAIAVEAALNEGDVVGLISAGLAGGCVANLMPGTVIEAFDIIESKTGECFESSSRPGELSVRWKLVSTERIASVDEKARLFSTYGAQLVDMEAATVGRLARAHDLDFRAIKAISDTFDFELSALAQFTGKHGSFRTAAFALHTALRPWTWSKAVELGRGSASALAALDQDLKLITEIYRVANSAAPSTSDPPPESHSQ